MKKIISVIIAVSVFAVAFVGCSISGPKPLNNSLTIYMDIYTFYKLNSSIMTFKTEHPEITFNIEKIYNNEKETSDFILEGESDAFGERLSTELMSGKGPDIILLSRSFLKRKDVYKMMKSGAFEDLTPYIEKDENFPAEQLNMPLIESVKYDEKQYLMPLSYDIDCIVTTKSTLEETKIDILDNKFFSDLLKDMNGYVEKAGNINNRRKLVSQTKTFADYPIFLQDSLLNYKNGTANIANNNEFREATELYKGIYSDEIITTGYQAEGNSAVTAEFDNKSIVFSRMRSTGATILPVWESQIILFDEPVLIPARNYKGEISGLVCDSCGVNANSQNKQIAYDLISFLLQEKQQETITQTTIPVNKTSLKNTIPDYVNYFYYNETTELPGGGALTIITDTTGKTGNYDDYPSEELPQEYLDEYYNMTQSVTKGYFKTPLTNGEIWNDMEPFFKGEKTYDECAQALQEKLDIYMSE